MSQKPYGGDDDVLIVGTSVEKRLCMLLTFIFYVQFFFMYNVLLSVIMTDLLGSEQPQTQTDFV